MLKIPFNVIATILREPSDAKNYPQIVNGISFYTSAQTIAQQLLSYIISTPTLNHALNQSLLKIMYTHNRHDFNNLPFNASDMLIEVFTHKINSAERNNGLACPSYWHSCSEEVWYSWFKVILQNQLRDILRASRHQRHQSLDSPLFEDSQISLLDLLVDAHSNRDLIEEAEITEVLQYSQTLQKSVILNDPNIPDLRRLCWILLKAPNLVTQDHFMKAGSQFSRPASKAYLLWGYHNTHYMTMYDPSDAQQIPCRSFLTWLLFGPDFEDDAEFSQSDSRLFNTCRDNLRQNVTRATANIHASILPFWIWMSHSGAYQRLWAHFLKESLSLAGLITGLSQKDRLLFNEDNIYSQLLALQEELNGHPVSLNDFRAYCSLVSPGFCPLTERNHDAQSFINKEKKLIKRFKYTHSFLPRHLQELISLNTL